MTQSKNAFFLFYRILRVMMLVITLICFLGGVIMLLMAKTPGFNVFGYVGMIACLVFSIMTLTSMRKSNVTKDEADKKKLTAYSVVCFVALGIEYVASILCFFLRNDFISFLVPIILMMIPLWITISFFMIYPKYMYNYKYFVEVYKLVDSTNNDELLAVLMRSETDEQLDDAKERTLDYIKRYKEIEYEELSNDGLPQEFGGQSRFDGGFWSYLGWTLLGGLLTVVTIGICYPIAMNFIYRWEAKHTVINGRRMEYSGKAGSIMLRWIGWILLSIITLGIYSLFVALNITRFRAENTHILGCKKEESSKFVGKAIGYFGMILLTGLIKAVTLGILTPVADAMMIKWRVKRTRYNGYHLDFDGHGGQLLGSYILWWLLGIITLGIYFLFIPIKLKQWEVKHTQFEAILKH